jgi:HK97 family phage major capsid protein
MESNVREKLDDVIKRVNDMAELNKKAMDRSEGERVQVKETIQQMVKEALAAHPGFTPERKIQFTDNKPTTAERILDSMPKELQAKVDDLFIISKVLQRPVHALKGWSRFLNEAGEFKKALDSATSQQGQEWVPTGFTSQLFELVRASGRVALLFPTIQMPTNPYKIPVEIGRINSFRHDEQTGDSGQTLIPAGDGNVTGSVTLTAVGHGTRVLVSKDLEEDSAVSFLPWIRNAIVRALAEGREDAILNGDTAVAHEDADITSASDRRKLWLGLRAIANDQSYKTDISTFNLTALRGLRKSLGVYGVNPSDLALIVGPSGYAQLLDIDEVKTLTDFGPSATILTGQLAALDGIPVIVSEFVRENLNATGVYDGTTTTKTGMYLVHRNAYVMGERRQPSVQLLRELFAQSDQDALVVRERATFAPIYPVAANKTVRLGFNLTA